MDNAMFVGVSKQMILQRELDVAANNLANVDTAGFKVETLITTDDPQAPARSIGVTQPVQFAVSNGLARDFTQGQLQQTGAPLDVAIEGQAFFTIQTADGPRYTRDGRFTTNAQGQLVTQAGDPVLDASGSPITLNAQAGAPLIAQDGTISQMLQGQPQAQVVGKLGVVRFDNLSYLSKQGDGLYNNTSSSQPQPANDAVLHQGAVEASNVQPIIQITDLIRITRTYESVSQMISSNQDLSDTAIQRLGSTQTS